MRRLLLGKFVLPFCIIVALGIIPLAFFLYRQVDKFGRDGLYRQEFLSFVWFYGEAVTIAAFVIAVATLVQAAFSQFAKKSTHE